MLISTRRALLAGAASSLALGLAGCNTTQPQPVQPAVPAPTNRRGAKPTPAKPEASADELQYQALYAPVAGEKFPVNAIPPRTVPQEFWRAEIDYRSGEAPGTIVIDPKAHYLYYILSNGKAMRYGVGVGREGFAWSGAATINSKQEWPDWYPPIEMIERQPDLKKQTQKLQSGIGVAGGPRNPLGARAMYLWQNNKDTLFRIHGTLEPASIGKSVSSGCIRMVNQDVIDLYKRVAIGTKVVVLGNAVPANAKIAAAARRG